MVRRCAAYIFQYSQIFPRCHPNGRVLGILTGGYRCRLQPRDSLSAGIGMDDAEFPRTVAGKGRDGHPLFGRRGDGAGRERRLHHRVTSPHDLSRAGEKNIK